MSAAGGVGACADGGCSAWRCWCPWPLLAAGCAIPTQGSPSAIPSSRVPFHLLDPHPPTTTTTQPKPSSYVGVKVYFLNTQRQRHADAESTGS